MNSTLKYILNKFKPDLTGPQPMQITQIGRIGLAELFFELGFTKGAEIGVDRGAYSEILCKANSNLNLYCIDSWSATSFENSSTSAATRQRLFDRHFKYAKWLLSPYNCVIIKKDSTSALKDFEDKSLDFVYIDADHTFPHIASDIYYWEKKVKVGGIISGHDYFHFSPERENHVKQVVDAYAKSFGINPYFELAKDRYHSWFWVK